MRRARFGSMARSASWSAASAPRCPASPRCWRTLGISGGVQLLLRGILLFLSGCAGAVPQGARRPVSPSQVEVFWESVPPLEYVVVEAHGIVKQLFIDCAFTSSQLAADVAARPDGEVVCRAVRVRNHGLYTKQDFFIDLSAQTIRCPAGQLAVIQGPTVHFEEKHCTACPQRLACQAPTAKQGRTIRVAPDEEAQQARIARQKTPEGRAQLRERTAVEHTLAHHCSRQGPRARYRGVAKNDFDACRTGAVNNLLVMDRMLREAQEDGLDVAA